MEVMKLWKYYFLQKDLNFILADPPFSSILYELFTILSHIASAMVGSPITSCQADTGSWLVIMVEASPCLSSNISRSESLEDVSNFPSPKSSYGKLNIM